MEDKEGEKLPCGHTRSFHDKFKGLVDEALQRSHEDQTKSPGFETFLSEMLKERLKTSSSFKQEEEKEKGTAMKMYGDILGNVWVEVKPVATKSPEAPNATTKQEEKPAKMKEIINKNILNHYIETTKKEIDEKFLENGITVSIKKEHASIMSDFLDHFKAEGLDCKSSLDNKKANELINELPALFQDRAENLPIYVTITW